MKPTGMPSTAAGRGAPASISSSRWNSAVGALPIATTAPSSRSPHSSSAAALRVVPSALGELGHARVAQRADDVVARGQPAPGDAGGDHRGVAEDRGARPQRAAGRGDDAGRAGEVVDQVDHARRRGSCGPRPAPGRPAARPGRPRRGSWRTSGGRSPRRPGRSRADGLIRRTARRRGRRARGARPRGGARSGARSPTSARRSVNRPATRPARGVGPHVGQRLGAARPSGAGAHPRHRRRGVDHEPGGGQPRVRRRPRAPGSTTVRHGVTTARGAARREHAQLRRGQPRRAPARNQRLGTRHPAERRPGGPAARPASARRPAGWCPPAGWRGAVRGRAAYATRRAAPARNSSAASSSAVTARGRGTQRHGLARDEQPSVVGRRRPASTGPASRWTTSPRPSSRANRNRPGSAASAGRGAQRRGPARGPGRGRRRARPRSRTAARRGRCAPARASSTAAARPRRAGRRSRRVVAAQAAQLDVAAGGQLEGAVAELLGAARQHAQLPRRRAHRRAAAPGRARRRPRRAAANAPGQASGRRHGHTVSARRRGPRHEERTVTGLDGPSWRTGEWPDRQLPYGERRQEAGANPARSRHCHRGADPTDGHGRTPGRPGRATIREPGHSPPPCTRQPGARTPRKAPRRCVRPAAVHVRHRPVSAPAPAAPTTGSPTPPALPPADLPALLDGRRPRRGPAARRRAAPGGGPGRAARGRARPVVVLGGEQAPDAELMELSTVPGGRRRRGARLPGARRPGQPRPAAPLPLRHGAAHRPRLRPAREPPPAGACWTRATPTTRTGRSSRSSTTGPTTWPATPPSSRRSAQAIEDAGGRALPVYCASLRDGRARAAATTLRHGRRAGRHRARRRRHAARPTASAGGDDEAWDVGALAALDVPILQGLCLTSSRAGVGGRATTGSRRWTPPPRSRSPSSTAGSSPCRSRSRRSTPTG